MLTTDRQIDRRITLGADSLEQAGWEVRIVAMPRDGGAEPDSRVRRLRADGSEQRGQRVLVDGYRVLRRLIGTNRQPMRALKRLVLGHLLDPERFYDRLFWPEIAGCRPRVVVAHDLPVLAVGARLAEAVGARLVYDSHELYVEQEFSAAERRCWQAIERRYIGRADAIITVNESIARELQLRYGLAHVNVISNAVPLAARPLRSRYFHERFSLDPGCHVLLYQGALSAGRSLDVLTRAMQHVRAAVVLVFLGDGELAGRLARTVRRLGLQDRVFFHAAVTQEALPAVTAAADAGVIPYQATCLNNHLCSPNKLYEFIGAGLPILANDLPEVCRLVRQYGIGRTAALESAQSIAELVDEVFADAGALADMRDHVIAARREVCWEVEARKLERIYGALA